MMKYHNTGGAGKDWGYLSVKKFSPFAMDGIRLTFETHMGKSSPRPEDGDQRTDIVLSREQLVDLHRRIGEHLENTGVLPVIEGEGF